MEGRESCRMTYNPRREAEVARLASSHAALLAAARAWLDDLESCFGPPEDADGPGVRPLLPEWRALAAAVEDAETIDLALID